MSINDSNREKPQERDHRALGEQLELFFFHESAPGSPYWLPKGVIVRNQLIEFWRQYHKRQGYQEVITPLLNKRELWEISGHWQHFHKDMVCAELHGGGEWALKPMNCANAMIIWKQRHRSYRELPLRLAETSVLHRNEASGCLQGLMRARYFCQDDSHNFVAPEQVGDEIREVLRIVRDFYGLFDLQDNVRLYFSTRPDKFMGRIEEWNQAEAALLNALQNSGIAFGVKEKDGAFYGPKIDIHVLDALSREWQCGTIQLDFQLPQNFELEYVAQDGSRKRPVVVHRAIYGSFDRFLGILLEHFAGNLPFWMAPVQVKVLVVGELKEYVERVRRALDCVVLDEPLQRNQLRFEIDDRAESLSKKVRDAEHEKVPIMVVIGQKEAERDMVSIRWKGGGQKLVELGKIGACLRDIQGR